MGFRKKIIAANWKMNKTAAEAEIYIHDLALELAHTTKVDVVVVPPFTSIKTVSDAVTQTPNIGVGAQNVHWEKSGAFTGEISVEMLRDLYVRYVVIGHSERRQLFGETNETCNKRIKAAAAGKLRPIYCVGETLDQREAGKVAEVVTSQLNEGLAGVTEDSLEELVIAYEPVWAIGTGKTASPEQAQEVHALIRKILSDLFGEAYAAKIRIQYGGSVKPANAKELMSQPDIDGALVGGASLDAKDFASIIKNAVA
ncbi:MAG: triose-phosphate isomerase [Verrucomicrobiota bacterium]|nr:triose-phosphate isomerase [Verrucomicrobiota bacterium]